MKAQDAQKLIVEKMSRSIFLSFAIVLVLAATNGRLNAQSDTHEFVPFQKFIATTAAAGSGD